MSKPKPIIVNVQTPQDSRAQSVIAQLEALLAENDAQHAHMVDGAKRASNPNTIGFYTGLQAAYSNYGDGLRDALNIIRTTFQIMETPHDKS